MRRNTTRGQDGLLQSCHAGAQINISRQGDEAIEQQMMAAQREAGHGDASWAAMLDAGRAAGQDRTGTGRGREEMGRSFASSWAIVTLFFARWVQQADGRGARRVCDSSDDDGARRQSGNTSGDRLLSCDERVSASLGAARQSAMVGSSATRVNCGGDALFSVSCSRAKLRAGVAQRSVVRCGAVRDAARHGAGRTKRRKRSSSWGTLCRMWAR